MINAIILVSQDRYILKDGQFPYHYHEFDDYCQKTKEEFASSDALRWHNADIINFGYPKEEITWLTNESANLVDSIKFRKVDIINLVVTSDS